MDAETLFELEWPYLLACLPGGGDLDESARRHGALTRRREVDSASTLLRLALAYGFCGLSLRQTAAWAEATGAASISNVALLKRLRSAASWLGYLLTLKLAESAPLPTAAARHLNLRLVDATTIRAPGSPGADFRLHLGFNLTQQSIDQLELSGQEGGETFRRFRCAPGDLLIADAGYAQRPGLYSVLRAGAHFLIKHNWWSLPLTGLDGQPLAVATLVRSLPDAQPRSFPVLIRAAQDHSTPAFCGWLALLRKSEAAAQQSRERLLRRRSRQQHRLDPRALELAAYTCLLTSLPPGGVELRCGAGLVPLPLADRDVVQAAEGAIGAGAAAPAAIPSWGGA